MILRVKFFLTGQKHCQKVITFGRSEGVDVRGYNIKGGPEGVKFKAKSTNFDKEFSLSMGGLFNVTNALATIAMTTALGISPDCIYDGQDAKVSGRMEVYHCPRKNFTVIVDYAHNKMSFEALFKSTMEEYPGKNMTIVFGCPGKKSLCPQTGSWENWPGNAVLRFLLPRKMPVKNHCLRFL